MPSHLTRVVFRSILTNKPLLYRGCLYHAARPRANLRNGSIPLTQPQRRSFLGLFTPERKVKGAVLPPGLDKLGELAHMQRINARPPPPEDVGKALTSFLDRNSHTYEDFDIDLAANGYAYLQQFPREDGKPWLSEEFIQIFYRRLHQRPTTGGQLHLAFVRTLHEDVVQRRAAESKDETPAPLEDIGERHRLYLYNYLRVLCLYGATTEAREIAVNQFSGDVACTDTRKAVAWTQVLRGFIREENQGELIRSANMMKELSVPIVQETQIVLVEYFANKLDLEQAKHWYAQPISGIEDPDRSESHGNANAAILKACALNGDLAFGQQVVASLLKNTPNKAAWDAVFIWSAAIGKGVDEVDRMMNIMVRKNEESRQRDLSHPIVQPDIDTINALVEFCMSKGDPYSAERYIALGEKRNIQPNEKTFAMQMKYRLLAKDVDGARTAYYGLQGSKDEECIRVSNELIRAMCGAKHTNFDDIMAIVDDLLENKARFEPETIAALCTIHLRRGEMHDAINLLQVHAHHYSPDQRVGIRERLFEFLLDRQNSTADAWDAYQILRQMFPETPRDIRLRVMNEFFERKRSDMACHVFFHMRNSTYDHLAANHEVYVAAFTGFARNADKESVELAHNQLRLDLNVEMDTKLRNALMLAYAGIGNNYRALQFWADIVASKEGPTYNSIAIAFRSCEGMSWGDRHAKPIWQRLKEMDVDIDKQIFTAYLSAIARNQLHDEAVAMLETVEEEYGFKPDLYILSNWFNATTNIERQGRVEAWIKEHYPHVWTEIESFGFWKTMDGFGYRQYNINRDLDP